MRLADLDAVTIDGFGTIVQLLDPVPALQAALAERGVDRHPEEVAVAFAAEAEYYVPRSLLGRDAESLADLRTECAGVFLREAGAELDAAEFAPAYVAALRFAPLPGVEASLSALRAHGLDLAVVSNWDCALQEHLSALGLSRFFSTIVTSAEAGSAKPDAAVFELALRHLGTSGARTLHVGDGPSDEEGARAAGMPFLEAPLPRALAQLR